MVSIFFLNQFSHIESEINFKASKCTEETEKGEKLPKLLPDADCLLCSARLGQSKRMGDRGSDLRDRYTFDVTEGNQGRNKLRHKDGFTDNSEGLVGMGCNKFVLCSVISFVLLFFSFLAMQNRSGIIHLLIYFTTYVQ